MDELQIATDFINFIVLPIIKIMVNTFKEIINTATGLLGAIFWCIGGAINLYKRIKK